MIVLKKVSKLYGRNLVLKDLSLRIAPGESVCIRGSTGSGKTLLIKLLLGLEKPSSGSIEIDNVPLGILPPPFLQHYRRKVGVATPSLPLISDTTIEENLALPLEIQGWSKEQTQEHTQEMLKKIGLQRQASALPEELPSSARALASLARACIAGPSILLLDDPLLLLEGDMRAIALTLLREAEARKATLVLCTKEVVQLRSPQEESLPDLSFTEYELSNGTLTKREQETEEGVLEKIFREDPALKRPAHRVKVTSIGPTV